MAYFKTCPNCGAHLDPGEACDCREDSKKRPLRCIGTTPGKRIPDIIIVRRSAEIKAVMA